MKVTLLLLQASPEFKGIKTMLESAGLIGFFSGSGEKSEEEIADLPENRERESFADVFKKKQQTLDQNGNR